MPTISLLSSTYPVQKSAADRLQLAIIPVPELVMTAKNAVLVFQLVRFAALTLNALYAVTSHVHHAWRIVRGPVSTKETVPCKLLFLTQVLPFHHVLGPETFSAQ